MKLQITIDGKTYAVDVEVLEEDESPQLPVTAPHQAGSAAGGHSPLRAAGTWNADGREYRSPVMGLVIKVNVAPGQRVEAGELLLVLEAMKMETNVTAPHAGTLRNIRVAQGDSVKVDQLLVEFE